MEDNLDIMEAVLLDDTMAILYVGQHSAGEGLTEDAQACIDHFSPYTECRGMAIKHNFQALTLTEGQDMIRAHGAQSHKTLRGQGRPRVSKLPALLIERMLIGMDVSPCHFTKGARSDKWMDHQHQKPLDRNNSALSQQLPRSMRSLWDRDASQSGYYSEDSYLDSALMTSVVTLNASAHEEWQSRETFD